jgi:hypothetical protein
MEDINVQVTTTPPDFSGLDFNFLRKEGISYIQKLAGTIWTDHNVHDPGVTILDQLCYAITDLSYRINFDIKDLIAEKNGDPYQSLYSPAEILTVNPVTILDIRKVIIDVEGVKNAWVEKDVQPQPDLFFIPQNKTLNYSDAGGTGEKISVKGLYRVLVEMNDIIPANTDVQTSVRSRLNACRSLCEDFSEIRILAPQLVTVSGNIEVGLVEDINRFVAQLLFRVASFISPQITFYSLDEQLEQGKEMDEIFDGPVLNHGFINDDELEAFERKTELHVSDIIREVMDEPGVTAVSNIALATGSMAAENWRLLLDNEKTPKLDLDGILRNLNTGIVGQKADGVSLNLIKNDLKVSVDKDRIRAIFYELRDATQNFPLDESERNIRPEVREYRNLGNYYSIQNHFQAVYGIGELGLPDSASVKRKAQAKQLKGYLLFFEQILANYFAQIDHAKNLFSFTSDSSETYFYQSLVGNGNGGGISGVPGVEELLVTPGAKENSDRIAEIVSDTNNSLERKNRFLSHLMARFNESLTDYSLLLYDLVSKETPTPMENLIKDKLAFLRQYPLISNERGKAFNYYEGTSWDTENISGLEKRIAAKLGIDNYKRRNLAGGDDEGFHMVEHILLRPRQEDLYRFSEYLLPKNITVFEASDRAGWVRVKSVMHGLQTGEDIVIQNSNGYDGKFKSDRVLPDSFEILTKFVGPGNDAKKNNITLVPFWIRTNVETSYLILTQPGNNEANVLETLRKDPYSLQLTFIFPDWPTRFQNTDFRSFIENTVREQTPVHLTVYIQWLNKADMTVFESAYKNFVEKLKSSYGPKI